MREHVYRRVRVLGVLQTVFCNRKGLAIATCTVLFFFTVIALRPSSEIWRTPSKWIQTLKVQSHVCPESLDWLNELNLTYPIAYARREIIVKPEPGIRRESIKRIYEGLFPEAQNIDVLEDATAPQRRCIPPLVLDVPAFPYESADASHISFGLTTSLPELDIALPYLERWLATTKAKFLGVIVAEEHDGTKDAPPSDAQKLEVFQNRMQTMGMNAQLRLSTGHSSSPSMRALSLVNTLYDTREDTTLCISIIDKDTFFPSVPALVAMLSKYDPADELYIGGLPESWAQVMHYGMIGHINAGIFISIP